MRVGSMKSAEEEELWVDNQSEQFQSVNLMNSVEILQHTNDRFMRLLQ